MAPRRNVKISAPKKGIQVASDKSTRKRLTQAKSKVSNCTTVLVSIPSNKEGLDVPDNKRKVDLNTKIALADEVAKSQLLKTPVEARTITTLPTPKRRKNQKMTGSEAKNNAINRLANVPKLTPPNTKKVNKKTSTKNPPVVKRVLTRKRVAQTSLQKPRLKRQKLTEDTVEEVPSNTNTGQGKLSDSHTTTKESSSEKRKVFYTSKESTSFRSKRLRTAKQGNNVNQETSPILQTVYVKSPVFQKHCIMCPVRQVSSVKSPRQQSPNTRSPKQQSPNTGLLKEQTTRLRSAKRKIDISTANEGRVGSSKASVSSGSNFSWTREISSSSLTSYSSTPYKDVVHIDRKIPIIKLTNIDSEIDKYKTKPVTDDKDSSSDDSSSSGSGINGDCSLSDINLNLSSISDNSIVTTIQDPELHNSDLNNENYGQAAENLMHALKKIDMEFINWIHQTEYVTSDLNRIKDKLFNILSNEFCAISHCRKLQEIANPTMAEDFNIDTSEESNNIYIPEIDTKSRKIEHENHDMVKKSETETETNSVNKKTVKSNPVVINCGQNNSTETDPVEHNKVENNLVDINRTDIRAFKNIDESSLINSSTAKNNNTSKIDSSNSNPFVIESRDELTKPSTSGLGLNKFNDSSDSRRLSQSDDSCDSKDFTTDVEVTNFQQYPYDDDDALSLFAESITALDSSRVNTSTLSTRVENRFEEYIPEPIQNNHVSPKSYTYCPTKIKDNVTDKVSKTVCEGENFTSICKEPNNIEDSIENSQELHATQQTDISAEECNPNSLDRPILMADTYKLKPKELNLIFSGYCFFNIIHKCHATLYNQPCRYSHAVPQEEDIALKLRLYKDEVLVKEYLLIRRRIILLRMYGMCFVKECARRQLTRILIEIAWDFIIKSQRGLHIDYVQKTIAVEITLMHLNNVDLSLYEDLLKLKVDDDILLSEAFMQIMSSSHNFLRFKSVFLSLTYYLVNSDRTFNLQVTEQILERVCILPFDEAVVRALIQILRLTNSEIFQNSIIEYFEKHISVNIGVWEEYLSVKRELDIEELARRKSQPSSQPTPLMQFSPITQPPPLLQLPSQMQPLRLMQSSLLMQPSSLMQHTQLMQPPPRMQHPQLMQPPPLMQPSQQAPLPQRMQPPPLMQLSQQMPPPQLTQPPPLMQPSQQMPPPQLTQPPSLIQPSQQTPPPQLTQPPPLIQPLQQMPPSQLRQPPPLIQPSQQILSPQQMPPPQQMKTPPLMSPAQQMPPSQQMQLPSLMEPAQYMKPPLLMLSVDKAPPVHSVVQPPLRQIGDRQVINHPEMRGVPLSSPPDTPNLDMNQCANEIVVPRITRTICGYGPATTFRSSGDSLNSSNSEDVFRHQKWRHKSTSQHMTRSNFSSPRPLMQPQAPLSGPSNWLLRKKQSVQRLVTIGGSPIRYRPPRPDYYNRRE